MRNLVLAIHINTDRLSAVRLSNSLKRRHIDWAAEFPIEGGADFTKALAPALERIVAQSPACSRCLVTLSPGLFHYRTLNFPFKSKAKVKRVLDLELEQHLPVEDVVTEFHCLPWAVGERQVNTVSLSSGLLTEIAGVLEAGGLKPDLVAPGGGYATARLLCRGRKDNLLFLHMDSQGMGLYLLGPDGISHMRYLGMEGAAPLDRVLTSACRAMVELLPPGEVFQGIVLSAPMEEWADKAAQVKASTGLKVSPFHLGDHGAVTWEVPAPSSPGVEDAAALALCHSRSISLLNFYRRQSGLAVFIERHRPEMVVTAVLAGLALVMSTALPLLEMQRLEKQVAALDREILGAFRSVFPGDAPLVDAVHQVKTRLAVLADRKADARPGRLNTELLDSLSRALPNAMDIVLTRLTRSPGELRLQGNADQFNTVEKMKTRCAAIAGVKAVDIRSAVMDTATRRITFNLTLRF